MFGLAMKATVDEANAEIGRGKAEIERLTKELTKLHAGCLAVQEDNSQYLEKNKSLLGDVAGLKTKNQELAANLSRATEDKVALVAAQDNRTKLLKEQHERELANARAATNHVAQENAKLSESLTLERSENERLLEERVAFRNKINELTGEVRRIQSERDTLEEAQKTLNRRHEEQLQSLLRAKEAQETILRNQLRGYQGVQGE